MTGGSHSMLDSLVNESLNREEASKDEANGSPNFRTSDLSSNDDTNSEATDFTEGTNINLKIQAC